MDKTEARRTKSNNIYQAKRGKIYDPEQKQFNCYRPVYDGSFFTLDCWVCDKEGNIHPGYNISPVPVHVDNLGRVVGSIAGAIE